MHGGAASAATAHGWSRVIARRVSRGLPGAATPPGTGVLRDVERELDAANGLDAAQVQTIDTKLSEETIDHWLTEIEMGTYLPRFKEHQITMEQVPALTRGDLRAIGVTVVGHQLQVLGSAKRWASLLAKRKRLHVKIIQEHKSTLLSAWISAFITADFMWLRDLQKHEVLDMNNQMSLVSSLMWFSCLSYYLAVNDLFPSSAVFTRGASTQDRHQVTPQHEVELWMVNVTKVVFLFAVACTFASTVMAVQNNLIIYQIDTNDFPIYMHGKGAHMQRTMVGFFLLGMWSLMAAWFFSIFASLAWPWNVILLVTILVLLVPPWWISTMQAVRLIFALANRESSPESLSASEVGNIVRQRAGFIRSTTVAKDRNNEDHDDHEPPSLSINDCHV